MNQNEEQEDFASIEDDQSESMQEDSMIDSMIDSMQENAMIDSMIDSVQENAMIDSMIDSMQEDAMIEDSMMDQMHPGSSKDSTDDTYTLVDKKFNCSTVLRNNIKNYDDVTYVIHKEFKKSSNTGKTAYFSYNVLDKNEHKDSVLIGNVSCDGGTQEHWVSWRFTLEDTIEKSHYAKFDDDNSSALFYPLNYNYAGILLLNKHNPCSFHFQKLNFLTENEITSCGDKFSISKLKSNTGSYNKFFIKDFDKNIIPLMIQISKYSSINEFIIVGMLKLANEHVAKINENKTIDKYSSKNRNAIFDYTDTIVDSRLKYIHLEVKNNKTSELNILLKKYNSLKSINRTS